MNRRYFIHAATVETFLGVGAYDDQFAAPTTDTGYLEGSTKLVRDQSGQEVVSSSTWYTDLVNAGNYTPDTRFTSAGVVSRVVGVNTFQTPLGIEDHVEVYLT